MFAGERASAVPRYAAVGIHDDLTPGQPGIAQRPTHDKAACRVDEDFGVFIEQFRREDGFDYTLNNRFADLLLRDLWRVLRGNQYRVHPLGLTMLVLNRHLTLAVGTQPGQRSILADDRKCT